MSYGGSSSGLCAAFLRALLILACLCLSLAITNLARPAARAMDGWVQAGEVGAVWSTGGRTW
jgi:hypothetical protein